MDHKVLIAFLVVILSITFTASFILFEIWRKGYSKIDPEVKDADDPLDHDKGVKWLFIACMLWSVTSVIGLMQLTNHLPGSAAYLQFILIVFSLTNSFCFILAMANFDEVPEEIRQAEEEHRKPRLAATVLNQINQKKLLIWISLMVAAAVLMAADAFLGHPRLMIFAFSLSYYDAFDVFTSFITLCWLGWAFFKTFSARNFPLLKWFAAPAFVLFFISQFGNAVHDQLPPDLQLPRIAFSVSMDGIVALLFFTLAFSWADKRAQAIFELNLRKRVPPAATGAASAGQD